MIEEIIAPYVKDVRKRDKLPVDQKALLIMDVFSGQMTQAVLDTLRKEDIVLSRVPAGMTYISGSRLNCEWLCKAFHEEKM